MNEPERHELFVLPDGVEKLTIEKDQRIQNAALFTIEREDHTVGNLLRMQLLEDPTVLFAGYKVPHPLEHQTLVKVQCNADGSPVEAMYTAVSDLVAELKTLEERFAAEVTRKSQMERLYSM